jgi:ribosome-binding factor A
VPNDYPRSHRVADFIQRELSGLIRSGLKDPRISPMLTIASVEVSRDLSVAKVYFSLFDPEERKETQEALVHASGFLRRQLARQMNTRSVPQLRFHYDDSAEKGAYMSALIAGAVASNSTIEEDTDSPSDSPSDSESDD